jgi:hypothetical protein
VLYQLSYFRIQFLFQGASLSIAGAKVQHFFEPAKLLPSFLQKKVQKQP